MAFRKLTGEFLRLRSDAKQRGAFNDVRPGSLSGENLLDGGGKSDSWEQVSGTQQ